MNQNKIDSMEAVGELPNDGNLLLREGGYPHLPSPTMSQFANKADYEAAIKPQTYAWNEAGTKPDHPCLCQTKHKSDKVEYPLFQYWNGSFFGLSKNLKEHALGNFAKENKSVYQNVQWREVQP